MKKYQLIILLLLSAFILGLFGNQRVVVRTVSLEASQLPAPLDELRIVHLSDLHFRQKNRITATLLARVPVLQPDLIVFTGDMVDAKTADLDGLLAIMQTLRKIAPVVCIPGNHEYWSGLHPHLAEALAAIDIVYLCNQKTTVSIDGIEIALIGLDDPAGGKFHESIPFMHDAAVAGVYTILLSHRPEYFYEYCIPTIDLVCAGHAHGGQFRIPGIGAIIAPDQGFLPVFTKGPYINNDTAMIVSCGLGNSVIPVRINNPPEIVLITVSGGKSH
jgi:uncharacterized protein